MTNVIQATKGSVDFETVAPEDLLDVVQSIRGRSGTGVVYAPPGQGVDRLLAWATTDIRLARDQRDLHDVVRCATNAVLHARRALACLVEWYLLRDGLSLCKDASRREDERGEILRARGLLDELTSGVLKRAIQRRNLVEHEYLEISLEEGEDIVELLRRTIQCLRSESDPANGPCLFGHLSHSISWDYQRGTRAEFYGWSDPAFLMCTFARKPWLGAIVPRDKSAALVRRTFFEDINVELLLEVLNILEKNFGRLSSWQGSAAWELLAVECGLT